MSAKEAYPEILREFHRMVLLPHELVPLLSGSIVVLMRILDVHVFSRCTAVAKASPLDSCTAA